MEELLKCVVSGFVRLAQTACEVAEVGAKNVNSLQTSSSCGQIFGAVYRGVLHLFSAVRYSIQGFSTCFAHETAFRQECLMAIPHFIAVVCVPMELWARFYLGLIWFVLIAVELINTAVESAVDLVSPEYNPLAKKAKDCCSAAVFCIVLLLGISWGIVILRMV